MEKIKLYGLGSDDNYSYFIFDKKIEFIKLFSAFLEKIGIDKLPYLYQIDEGSLISIDEATDTIEHVYNGNFDVEVFYGKEKIIVVIRSNEDREKYIEMIKEFADFP